MQLSNLKSRKDSSCKKCLTQWTTGLFTLKIKPSNHRRKRRRQYRIERLQEKLKTTESKNESSKLKRQVQHLQSQNNHVAVIYANVYASIMKSPIKRLDKHTFCRFTSASCAERRQIFSIGSRKRPTRLQPSQINKTITEA